MDGTDTGGATDRAHEAAHGADGAGPDIAIAGTAGQAAQAAQDPVIIGAARTPIEPGGPGVGAAKTASEERALMQRPLTEAASADLGLRGPLSTDERAELEELRRHRTRPGIVVDAAAVRGRRLARAATAIKRDGVLYGPIAGRPWVPVDFEGYTELVQIGAITDTPWSELEPDDEY